MKLIFYVIICFFFHYFNNSKKTGYPKLCRGIQKKNSRFRRQSSTKLIFLFTTRYLLHIKSILIYFISSQLSCVFLGVSREQKRWSQAHLSYFSFFFNTFAAREISPFARDVNATIYPPYSMHFYYYLTKKCNILSTAC